MHLKFNFSPVKSGFGLWKRGSAAHSWKPSESNLLFSESKIVGSDSRVRNFQWSWGHGWQDCKVIGSEWTLAATNWGKVRNFLLGCFQNSLEGMSMRTAQYEISHTTISSDSTYPPTFCFFHHFVTTVSQVRFYSIFENKSGSSNCATQHNSSNSWEENPHS